jgi:hypothetical protein
MKIDFKHRNNNSKSILLIQMLFYADISLNLCEKQLFKLFFSLKTFQWCHKSEYIKYILKYFFINTLKSMIFMITQKISRISRFII